MTTLICNFYAYEIPTQSELSIENIINYFSWFDCFHIVLLKAHMTNRSLKLDSMKQEKDSSFLEGYLAMHKKLVGVRISVTHKESPLSKLFTE